jgi:hypothetical protein
LEAVIGQLYPATLLARLVTLELRGSRQVAQRHPAMPAQPRLEVGGQLRLGRQRCRDGGPAPADSTEVPAKNRVP